MLVIEHKFKTIFIRKILFKHSKTVNFSLHVRNLLRVNSNGENGALAALTAAVEFKQKLQLHVFPIMLSAMEFRSWNELATIKLVRLANGFGVAGVNVLIRVVVVSE